MSNISSQQLEEVKRDLAAKKEKKPLARSKVHVDKAGNKLRVVEHMGVGVIELTLHPINKGPVKRKAVKKGLGQIKYEDGLLIYKKKVKERDIFRKHQAWGLNHAVVTNILRPDTVIVLISEKRHYIISLEDALKVGIEGGMKGFEKQLFIPLTHFER